MDFLIATHNMKKRAELERILKPIGVRVLLAEEAGVELTDVEETGVTFEENAFLKADSGCKESGMPCIAGGSCACNTCAACKPAKDSPNSNTPSGRRCPLRQLSHAPPNKPSHNSQSGGSAGNSRPRVTPASNAAAHRGPNRGSVARWPMLPACAQCAH